MNNRNHLNDGKKMKQQSINLLHCKRGIIGTCLWFNANTRYSEYSYTENGIEYFTFTNGPKEVVEKIIIGNHTFFKVVGY